MQNNSGVAHIGKPSYNAAKEKENNVIGNAFVRARKRQDLTQIDIIEKLEQYGVTIGQRTYSNWETGQTTPNPYQLIATCFVLGIKGIESLCSSYCPSLNSEGLSKLREYENLLIATGLYQSTPDPNSQIDNVEFIDVLQATLRVSAGTGQFLDDDHMETISLPRTSVPSRADFAVIVSGDSMMPDFVDGQRVWVKRTETLKENEIGIFIYDGEAFIKQYHEVDPPEDEIDQYMNTDGVCHKQIVLVSLNPQYAPRVIKKSYPFQIVGRVLTLA